MKKKHHEWLELYKNNLKNANKSERTITNYASDLKQFITWFEANSESLLNKADGQVISDYKNFLSNQRPKSHAFLTRKTPKFLSFFSTIFKFKKNHDVSISTINKMEPKNFAVASKRRHLSSIKNYYDFLKQVHEDQDSKLFKANPVKSKLHGIKLKDEDVDSTKLLTKEDWKNISDTLYRPKEKLIAHLLYFGGLRLSELSNLKVSSFNEQNYSLTFVRKGGDLHTLYIQETKKIFALLDRYLQTRPYHHEYLFSNKKGAPLSSRAMYNLIMIIIEKSNCKTMGLTPHSFRKACATNLYEKTKDLLFVRDYLNHSDASVTQTYIENSNYTDSMQRLLGR